jgi:hypothetical protein
MSRLDPRIAAVAKAVGDALHSIQEGLLDIQVQIDRMNGRPPPPTRREALERAFQRMKDREALEAPVRRKRNKRRKAKP